MIPEQPLLSRREQTDKHKWRPLAQNSSVLCCRLPHGLCRQRHRANGRYLPLPLRLVTLAGKEIETTVPLSIYHHWEMLEDYLVELLAQSFDLDTFGCELMLISEDARSPLSDPIHEELWEDNSYQLIIQKSFRVVSSKEQIRREAYDDHPRAISRHSSCQSFLCLS